MEKFVVVIGTLKTGHEQFNIILFCSSFMLMLLKLLKLF